MLTYELTRDQFESRKKEAAVQGFPFSGDVGTISQFGVSVDYCYDGDKLTLIVTKAPFPVPKSYIENKIAEYFYSS